jgi:ankyrin repeat protein
MASYSQEYPLHQAAADGDATRLRQLLADDAKIDARTASNETPLIAAAERGRSEAVQCLIEAGAKLDAKTKASAITEGRLTALHRAVQIGHHRIAKLVLQAGAEVDPISQSHMTPLVHACHADNIDMIRLLLDHGANPNGCAAGYDTPLVIAAGFLTASIIERQNLSEERTVEIVRELLKRGADPNLQGGGSFPLHATRSVAVTMELLAAGADVNARNRDGETPLLQWALTGKLDLLRCYVEAGADVNVTANNGDTPLRRIFERTPPEIEILELLVSGGGDINAVDLWGRSLLDYYVWLFERQQRQAESAIPAFVALFGVQYYTEERTRYIQFLRDRGAKRTYTDTPKKSRRTPEKSRT